MNAKTLPTGHKLLPGPVQAAHSVTIRANSHDWSGATIRKSETIEGDGRGTTQVLEHLQANYSAWYPFLGCTVFIDFGHGSIARTLDERFGVFSLA